MKKGLMVRSALFFCLFFTFSFPVYAGFVKGDFGIGLNYPGFGVRYFLSDKISLEGKGQFEKDIFVGGLRGYYYFKPEAKVLSFVGLEADFVSFKGEESEGNGFAGELFVGGEYFFAKKLSMQLDFGPAYIFLEDKDTSEFVGDIEYVVNFGINYYFGK